MSQETDLIKHSAAIHINNSNATLNTRKLFNILLKNAFLHLRKNTSHKILLTEVTKQLGWSKNSNTNEELKETIRTMVREPIEFNVLTKDKKNKWGLVTVLSGAEIEEGILTYRYDTVLSEILANPTIYARINMVIQGKFRSKYALALWEYLVEYLCVGKKMHVTTDKIELNKLRLVIGGQEEYYNDFRKFNQKILSPAINEINKLADISTNVIFYRNGRKSTHLAFEIIKKGEHPSFESLSNSSLPEEIVSQEDKEESILRNLILELMTSFNINESSAKKIIANKEKNIIYNAIKAAKEYIELKNIANKSAIIKKAISEEWLPNKADEEIDLIIQESKIDEFSPTDIINKDWESVLKKLKKEVGAAAYKGWISHIKFSSVEKEAVNLYVKDNNFIKEYIENNYIDLIIKTWSSILPSISNVRIKLVK